MKVMFLLRREDDDVVLIINTLWLASYFGLRFCPGQNSTVRFVFHMSYQNHVSLQMSQLLTDYYLKIYKTLS